jgi:hypothetical protein
VMYPLSAAFEEWRFSQHVMLLDRYSIGFTLGMSY